jgi:hypothetical protein
VTEPRDPTLDVLLDLDGQVLVVDPDGGHWVRFVVTLVPASSEKPHGTLLADFWTTVDAVLRERGVIP